MLVDARWTDHRALDAALRQGVNHRVERWARRGHVEAVALFLGFARLERGEDGVEREGVVREMSDVVVVVVVVVSRHDTSGWAYLVSTCLVLVLLGLGDLA